MKLPELKKYKSQNVHIVGASSAEGFAILDFLMSLQFSNVTAHDTTDGDTMRRSFNISHVSVPEPDRQILLDQLTWQLPISRHFGSDYLTGINEADLIFATQNWFAYERNQPIRDARIRGVPVRFLIQLYFDLSPAPIAAITGTNGKTTVSNLLYHIISQSEIPVLMSGNDRYHPQVLNKLNTLPSEGCLVLEVSNRQLKELEHGPRVGVITNIEPDHIEDHGSYQAYIDAKARLFERQSHDDFAVINMDLPSTAQLIPRANSHVVPYSLHGIPFGHDLTAGIVSGVAHLQRDSERIALFSNDDLHLPGSHNLANALAAATAAALIGVDPNTIRHAISNFSGVHNRIEHILTVNGVDFYDDLASTNPAATRAALLAFTKPVVLIAGGDAKGNLDDYVDLARIASERLRCLIRLPGDAGEAIEAALAGAVPVYAVDDLKSAVTVAADASLEGDAVILSPAGASFYTRFIVPSPGFRRLVRDLQRKARRR